MTQVESQLEDLKRAKAQPVFIAAEKRDGMWKPSKFLAKRPIQSVFLLDEDRNVTKAYGLHHGISTDAFNIAHPATLIIEQDKEGAAIVRYIYRGENQLDRSPMDKVIAELERLR